MQSSKASRERFAEWLRDTGKARFGFDKELAGLTNRSRGGVRNELPPFELWPNILPTLRLLERVREQFGPTTITSGYRSPAYNKAVDGKPKSQHMKFFAIDFFCASGTPKDWAEFLLDLRSKGNFKGGVGLYKTFVHVDTRGTNADF